MTGLFATDGDIVFTHGGGNIRVADGSDFGCNMVFFGPIEETLVRHDGDGDFI